MAYALPSSILDRNVLGSKRPIQADKRQSERMSASAKRLNAAERPLIGQFAEGAYVPRFGLRGFGVGSSAAVTRSSSPSHSASSYRSAGMSICGLAPRYGGASDTGSAWARPDTVGLTKS
jgi:hypothetical protein